jgi:hypothetical protein
MKIKLHVVINARGDKKNKPVIGMVIMTGLKHDGNMYSGGEITRSKKRQNLQMQNLAGR